jgi:hypothetical protein
MCPWNRTGVDTVFGVGVENYFQRFMMLSAKKPVL